MRAAVIDEPRKIEVRQVDDPGPKEGYVVVDVKACGVCHTDRSIYKGSIPDATYPIIPGHEIIGRIEDESHVLVSPVYGCYDCFGCDDGNDNLCKNGEMFGKTVNGGFAERVLVPENYVFRVNEKWGIEHAVLPDAYATSYHGFVTAIRMKGWQDTIENLEDEHIAIFGSGGVGSAAIDIAKSVYATVYAVDTNPESIEMAKSMGADHTFLAELKEVKGKQELFFEDQRIDKVLKKESDDEIRIALDCAGFETSLKGAYRTIRNGGDAIAIGYSSDKITQYVGNFMATQKGIKGIWGCPHQLFEDFLNVIGDKLNPEKLITKTYDSLDDVPTALEEFKGPGRAVVKIA